MTLTLVAADGADRPMARPASVKLPEYERRIWRHMIPAGVDWYAALERAYWTSADVLRKFAPGDRVECFTSDYEVGFEILIQEIVPLAEHVRFAARPLFPHELVLPSVTVGEEPRYFMRQGLDRQWEVVDRASGKVVRARIGRGAADEECHLRNTADRDAKALVAARELAPEPEGAPPATATEPEEAAAAPGVAAAAAAAPVPAEAPPAYVEDIPIEAIDDLTGLPREGVAAEVIDRGSDDDEVISTHGVAAELAALGRGQRPARVSPRAPGGESKEEA